MTSMAYISLTRYPQTKAHGIAQAGQVRGFREQGIEVDEFSAHRRFTCWKWWWVQAWYRFLWGGYLVNKALRGKYDVYYTRCIMCAWWLSVLPKRGLIIWEVNRVPSRLRPVECKIDFKFHLRDYPAGWHEEYNDFTVGYVGSMVTMGESKGVEEVQERLKQEGIRFEIVTGVPHAIALRAMKGFDVLVIPYAEVTEGLFTLKTVEYMSSGVPVVAWDTPGIEKAENVRKVVSMDDMIWEIKAVRNWRLGVPGLGELAKEEVKKYTWSNRARDILSDSCVIAKE